MNKEDLVSLIANEADIPKSKADKALRTLISGISDSLKRGENVTIVGFGTFTVSERGARQGRNPRTGATMNIPASRSPKFRPGKALKEAVGRD